MVLPTSYYRGTGSDPAPKFPITADDAKLFDSIISSIELKLPPTSAIEYVANVRCIVCGDSPVRRDSKRGYFFCNNAGWGYMCHNTCGLISKPRLTEIVKQMKHSLTNGEADQQAGGLPQR